MTGLIVFVARAGMIDVRQPVERKLSVALEPFRRRPPVDFLVCLVPGVRAHRIDQAAATGEKLQTGVKKSAEHAVLKGLMEIADLPQLFLDVALLDFFWKRSKEHTSELQSPYD